MRLDKLGLKGRCKKKKIEDEREGCREWNRERKRTGDRTGRSHQIR